VPQKAKATVRQADLDFVRIISIVAVITIHGIAGAVLTKHIGSPGWQAANIIDSFARWAVPVFLMLSGALLIKPAASLEVKSFFKKRFSRILIPLLAWPVIYTLWYAYYSSSSPNWGRLVIDFVGGVNVAPHLYFLFIIAGLYVITPLINIIRGAVTDREFLYISVVVLAITTIWYTIASFVPGHTVSLDALTQCIPYIGYYMLGSSIKNIAFRSSWTPIALFIISCCIMAAATVVTATKYGTIGKGLFFYSYFSILTAIMAPLAFFALRNLYSLGIAKIHIKLQQRAQNAMVSLSNATFGVYLIHMIVLTYLTAHLHYDENGVKGSVIYITLTVICSYAISLGLIKIPYLRRLIA
jgi:surface polysaccharide O-acyltransferase-like enzyme